MLIFSGQFKMFPYFMYSSILELSCNYVTCRLHRVNYEEPHRRTRVECDSRTGFFFYIEYYKLRSPLLLALLRCSVKKKN